MSLRKISFLLVVLGALLLYITKVEMAKDQERRAAERPLEHIAAAAFEEVTISGAKGSFALVNSEPKSDTPPHREGDATLSSEESARWSLKGIADSHLDRGALNALLSAIRSISLDNQLSSEETEGDLSVYGLAQPELTIAVKGKTADGSVLERRYDLGKLNEYVSKRYIKDAATPSVYMTSNDIFLAAYKEPGELRDATPVNLEGGAIRKLRVAPASGTGFSLEQIDGVWRISNPGPFAANQVSVDSVLREIRNLKVSRFIDGVEGKLSAYGLDAPTLIVESEPAAVDAGAPLYLTFGRLTETGEAKGSRGSQSKPRFYMSIRGQSPIFEISYDPVPRIAKAIKDLRDRDRIKLDTEQLAGVTIVAAGREDVALALAGEAWTVNSKPADEPFVREFLSSLVALSAIDFPDEGTKVDPTKLTAKILLTLKAAQSSGSKDEASSPKMVVRVGSETSSPVKGYLADIEGGDETFIISTESLRKITPRVETLVKSASPAGEPAQATAGGVPLPSATPTM